jgi:flagellar biosynthesis protein FliR
MLLSGLRLGGEWIDRHTGLGMAGILGPGQFLEGSIATRLLLLLGVASILLLEPVGGHLLFVRTVLETFRSIPLGAAHDWMSFSELIGLLLKQSLVLGLRIALPLVVMMSLIDMTLAFASRSSSWSFAPKLAAARMAVGVLILTVSLPGIVESITVTVLDSVRLSTDTLRNGIAVTSPPDDPQSMSGTALAAGRSPDEASRTDALPLSDAAPLPRPIAGGRRP